MTVHADRSQPHRGLRRRGAQPIIWQFFQNMCEILKKSRTEGMGSASLSNGSCTLHGTETATANHCSLLYCAPPSPRPCFCAEYDCFEEQTGQSSIRTLALE